MLLILHACVHVIVPAHTCSYSHPTCAFAKRFFKTLSVSFFKHYHFFVKLHRKKPFLLEKSVFECNIKDI